MGVWQGALGRKSAFEFPILNYCVAWINLGNGRGAVTQDIVTHEFGHALGLGNHFDGFGSGASISRAFWDVLATLYANPVRTKPAS